MHQNSVEHLSWSLPLLLVGGLFFPTFSASMGCVVIAGRELYRQGYTSNDGPNSKIREMGAIPLNVAEMLMMLGIGAVAMGYFFGPFFKNRRFVQRFTMSKFDIKYKEVLKKISEGRPV